MAERAAGQRTVLVVDLDGGLLLPLRALEEVLLCLGLWEHDDERDPDADSAPWRLPAPLADRVALGAVQRLLAALAPTQSLGPGGAGCSRRTAVTSTRG